MIQIYQEEKNDSKAMPFYVLFIDCEDGTFRLEIRLECFCGRRC